MSEAYPTLPTENPHYRYPCGCEQGGHDDLEELDAAWGRLDVLGEQRT